MWTCVGLCFDAGKDVGLGVELGLVTGVCLSLRVGVGTGVHIVIIFCNITAFSHGFDLYYKKLCIQVFPLVVK